MNSNGMLQKNKIETNRRAEDGKVKQETEPNSVTLEVNLVLKNRIYSQARRWPRIWFEEKKFTLWELCETIVFPLENAPFWTINYSSNDLCLNRLFKSSDYKVWTNTIEEIIKRFYFNNLMVNLRLDIFLFGNLQLVTGAQGNHV